MIVCIVCSLTSYPNCLFPLLSLLLSGFISCVYMSVDILLSRLFNTLKRYSCERVLILIKFRRVVWLTSFYN